MTLFNLSAAEAAEASKEMVEESGGIFEIILFLVIGAIALALVIWLIKKLWVVGLIAAIVFALIFAITWLGDHWATIVTVTLIILCSAVVLGLAVLGIIFYFKTQTKLKRLLGKIQNSLKRLNNSELSPDKRAKLYQIGTSAIDKMRRIFENNIPFNDEKCENVKDMCEVLSDLEDVLKKLKEAPQFFTKDGLFEVNRVFKHFNYLINTTYE